MLLLGQRQLQLGRLPHQTPPAHLPRIQQTHTRRRSYPTTTGHTQSLRPHSQQTSTCKFSLPITGLFGSTCSCNNSTTASVICCPIQAPLRSPTNEPTIAPVFFLSLRTQLGCHCKGVLFTYVRYAYPQSLSLRSRLPHHSKLDYLVTQASSRHT